MKTFELNGETYTVRPCTAVADGDTARQNALYVETVADSGELFNWVVFGWDFSSVNDIDDFISMCDDPTPWDSDWETIATVEF